MKTESNPLICQVAGFKNAGKTTVMTRLIEYFSAKKMKTATLKHHGHGGEPDIIKNRDSSLHMEAGSIISGVKGKSVTDLVINVPDLELDALIDVYRLFSIDILLIEGFKMADFPKIVLVKEKEDLSLLHDLANIIAVGSWDSRLLEEVKYPAFSISSMDNALPMLAELIKKAQPIEPLGR